MTDPDFRAARPKPAPGPDPTRPPHGPDPEEPQVAKRSNGPSQAWAAEAKAAAQVSPALQPLNDPLRIMRHITYALRPLARDQRRMVLETLLEISE